MPNTHYGSVEPTSPEVVDQRAAQPEERRGLKPPPTRRRGAVAVPLLAFAAYLAYAIFVTWPWVTDPSETLYGVIGGDLTGNVSGYEQLVDEHQLPFLPGDITQLNAPEGVPINWALHVAAFGSSTTLWLLSLVFGSIAAHGIVAVFGYALSAFAMFLLVRWVTDHGGAAFVVGLAFGFWPYTYGTGYTWPHYIHLWVFVLLVWRMLVLAKAPSLRNGFLAGAAAAFALTWIAYNLLIAGVVYGTLAALAVGRSVFDRTFRSQLVAQSAAAVIVGVALLVVLVAGRATDYAGVPTRSTAESVQNSARPAMYVVPGPRHPILGDRTTPWLYDVFSPTVPDAPLDKAIYADIYLGDPLLLVAVIGAVWTLVMVWRRPRALLRNTPVAAGVCALVLGAVGLAFSAPPKVSIFGLLVPMPYTLVQQVTMVFRVPHRFAIVVMLATCLLAGLALAWLLRRRGLVLQAVTLITLGAIFAVDLAAFPSPRTTAVDYPAIYGVLERQPPGVLAEYPLNGASAVESLESFYQERHGHTLFMGAPRGSLAESRKFELQFLLAERTAPDLAAYGVHYVLVHHRPSVQGQQTTLDPRPGQPVRGLRLIGGDASASLYRIVARASTFTSYGVRGFHLTEGPAPGMRWTAVNGAELELRGRCRPCVGTVTLPAASFAQLRLLTIDDERGRTLFTGRVGAGRLVRFHVRFSRKTVVRLRTDPPPKRINSVIPGPDTRTVSISLGQPVTFAPDVRGGHRPIR
jgi:hypothetical protein